MKRQNTVIYICVIITLLNVAGLLFIACKSNSPIATASTPVQSSTSGYYSDAYMPEALTLPERPYRCNAWMYRKHFGKN